MDFTTVASWISFELAVVMAIVGCCAFFWRLSNAVKNADERSQREHRALLDEFNEFSRENREDHKAFVATLSVLKDRDSRRG